MTSQYGTFALRAVLARLYARRRKHTPTHMGDKLLITMHRAVSNYTQIVTKHDSV
jgi:hypothetical protein